MDHSPLNELPAELRNEIYGYLLELPKEIEIEVPEWIICNKDQKPLRNAFALLCTCRQIREEGYPILLSSTKFIFRTEISECFNPRKDEDLLPKICSSFCQWIERLGKHSKHLSHVRITTIDWYAYSLDDEYLCNFYPVVLKRLQDVFKGTHARPTLSLQILCDEEARSPLVHLAITDKETAEEAVQSAQKKMDSSVDSLSEGSRNAEAVRQVKGAKDTLSRFLLALQSSK